jgi:hypothetical protein
MEGKVFYQQKKKKGKTKSQNHVLMKATYAK